MNTNPAVAIDQEQITRFWRDGALCVRNVFEGWVDQLRGAIKDVLAAPEPLAQDPASVDYRASGHQHRRSFYIELGLWTRHPVFREFAIESPAADIAGNLLETSEVNLFFDQLFVKEPQSPTQSTPWHQDQAYWPISGWQVVSIWVALDPVSQATGALRYVKGSHHWPNRFCPRDFGPSQRALKGIEGSPVPDIDAEPQRYEILSWDLAPGDCLVHHGLTLHSAAGNTSQGTRRRAHSIRFTGNDVRWDPRPGILERIPLMTSLPLTLGAGDTLTCEAFPLVRRPCADADSCATP